MESRVTLCVIMQNEEKYLPTFLDNIRGVFTDYVFLDGGSTDKSVELVEKEGYKVHFRPFKMNFADQKNKALELSQTKWRMVLDIDETMSRGLSSFFKTFDEKRFPQRAICAFFRDNFLDDIHQDDAPLSFVARFFDDSVQFVDAVHEYPYFVGKVLVRLFPGRIWHRKDSYKQYRANLIYELIRRGITEVPPLDQGAYNEDGRLRLVKLLPDRKIQPLDEYLEGPLLNT